MIMSVIESAYMYTSRFLLEVETHACKLELLHINPIMKQNEAYQLLC